MNSPSEEQQRIIDFIKDGKNVTVNAVAGSGKSTVILHLRTPLSPRIFSYKLSILNIY